ncbi:putative disease resistance protein At3g14460 [Rhodamnia argentea]|uniref:Disease resistance protein At3g14460 n=1 Tax=Rhodamnia argentea TaxID=178133 RepID=A0ABM3HIR9_9MYRT|nr:putative disease resistance protein At3g14460 [Rhodamnia argentea]
MDASPSIISLPSLKELSFGGCNVGVLKRFVNLTSVTALVIEDVAGLTWLSHGFTSSLIKLEMKSCKELMYLWQDRDVIRDLTCLKSLVVQDCPGLVSLAAGEEDTELPVKLETIRVWSCDNLEKLPSKMHALSSLRDLTIKCPKLVSFPETGIPTSVITLRITECKMLQSLPIIGGLSSHPEEPSSSSSSRNNHVDMMSRLQVLTISGCDSLPASPFSEGGFLPATLRELHIMNCRGVESLAEINVDRLQSLQEIDISNCEKLRSLPQDLHTLSHLTSLQLWECPTLELECFPPLPPSISKLHLWGCPKIKALPDQLHRLTCLRDLKISGCESITRFPDGGLPPQLQKLTVYKCGNMKQPVREWLTPLLTSLEWLLIDGSSMGGVREEEDLLLPLPSSLLRLQICGMDNMERLSSSLPPSLRILWISGCPKLRELPPDGLPPSLETLRIDGPSIMKERCMEGTGCYWPLIREIPFVWV